MNYTHLDDLTKLRAGDTVTLEDGTIHTSIKDKGGWNCENVDCSLIDICAEQIAYTAQCGDKKFHFEII